jgi:multimeric flavodoxin WrbA
MKIIVFNGSPKGDDLSVTMKFISYIKKLFPEHHFISFNIGQLLNNMRIRDNLFQQIIKKVDSADGILWAFPIYTTLVPAQLKKFIELLSEKNINTFKLKYTLCLSTSMKFFDTSAHTYMHAVCEDLGMNYVGFFSAHSYDFLKFSKRKKWYLCMKNFLNIIKEKGRVSKRFNQLKERELNYTPEPVEDDKRLFAPNKNIVVLTDHTEKDSNLAKMITRWKNCFKNKVEVYNIYDISIKGGCLGCLKCGLDNNCVYQDDFGEFFKDIKENTDILVLAGIMRDRFLSARWKLYFDRSFHNGHTPSMKDKQVCFLISGPLNQNGSLREWIKAITEVGYGNLVDLISDDVFDPQHLDELIYNMAKKAMRFSKQNYVAPPTFYRVGGYKIFRDMIFGLAGALFRMDYKFFKEHSMFDFPTRDLKGRISRSFLSFLLHFKRIRKKMKSQMKSSFVSPFQEKLDDIDFNMEIKKLKA